QEPDRIQEPVVAVHRDCARDTEEGRRRQVVTGDGDAVLRTGERAARGVVVRGGSGAAAGPHDDDQRDGDEQAEDGHVQHRVAALQGVLGKEQGVGAHREATSSSSPRSLSATGSRCLFACRTYSAVMTNVETNWPRPNSKPTLTWPNTSVDMNSGA